MNISLLENYRDSLISFESTHYILNAPKGSLAEKDFKIIARNQETCYATFLKALGLKSRLRIHYYFFTSPLTCGKQYRLLHPDEYSDDDADEEVNGYTSYPDVVFATYNEKIKCVGYHEDVHLLMAEHYGNLKSCFVKEGVAMAFDEVWWGIENDHWAKIIVEKGIINNIADLYDNELFSQYHCMYTYPLAGSFTKWLIKKMGINAYKEYYRSFNAAESFPSMSYRKDMVDEYAQSLKASAVEQEIRKKIEKVINSET